MAAMVAVLALVVGAAATLAAGYLGHQIQSGDTLSEIAEQYGTTVEELAALNNIDDPDLIITGDGLLIRPLQLGDDPSLAIGTHVVMEGDTLSEIARALGVNMDDLAAANGIADPDLIVPGSILIAPAATLSQTVEDAVETQEMVSEADEASDEAESYQVEEDASEDDVAEPIIAPVVADPPAAAQPVQSGAATLHLVLPGETLESIAESYGVGAPQLLAANGHVRNGVTAGIILRIPPPDAAGVQLLGMPTALEVSAVGSELTAVTVATSYWGSPVSEGTLLGALDSSDNPHLGFRGDAAGNYGNTDDYGVYAGPLAEALAGHGFVGDVFYADGDATLLTSRIDRGVPVVVWMTYQAVEASTERIDDGVRPFTLVTDKQATVVYGYDDAGVLVVDLATGGYSHISWSDFMRSWGYFDGMSLAISPI